VASDGGDNRIAFNPAIYEFGRAGLLRPLVFRS